MICKKVSAGIGAMRRIKPFVPVDTLEKVYKSLLLHDSGSQRANN